MRSLKKSGAVMMIALFLMLPVYSASAYAQIDSVKMTGETGVNGYRKISDFTRVEVNITGTNVQTSQVTVNNVAFSAVPQSTSGCEDKGNSKFSCFLQAQRITAQPSVSSYQIGYSGSQESSQLVIDGSAPNVTMGASQGGKNVTVTYNIVDKAGNVQSLQGLCAGIKRAEILDGNSVIATLSGTNPGNCQLSGTRDVNIPTSGNHNVCVKAYDNLWKDSSDSSYVGQACETVNVDRSAPVVTDVNIVDNLGFPVNYISNQIGELKIRFNLTEANTPENFTVDASDLIEPQNLKQNAESLSASCVNTGGNRWRCDTQTVQPILTGQASVEIKISGQDNLGNIVAHSSTRTLSIDTENPTVISMAAEATRNNINYVGPKKGKIIVTFNEAFSGFSKKNVFLDLSSYMGNTCCPPAGTGTCNLQCTQVRATDCQQAGSEWTCYWDNARASSSLNNGFVGDIHVVSPSQDDAGNFVAGSSSASVTVDKNPPVVNSIRIFPSSFGTPHPPHYFVAGDSVVANVNVSDDSQASGTADFSSVVPGESFVEGTCSDANICSFGAGPVVAGQNKAIKFYLEDGVGNNATNTTRIDVLTTQNATVVDYWGHFDSEIVISPSKGIDRQLLDTTEGYPYAFVYAKVPLRDNSGGSAWPIFVDASDCTSVGDEFKPVLVTGTCSDGSPYCPEVLNAFPLSRPANFQGAYTLWLKYYFEYLPSDVDSFPVTCNISIISRVGNRVLPREIETVKITVPLYNNPLGELSASVKKEIKDVRGNWLVKADWLGKLQSLVDILKFVCGIWKDLIAASNIMSGVVTAMGTCKSVAEKSIPWVAAICDGVKTGADAAREILDDVVRKGWTSFGKKFCSYLSCGLAYSDTWGKGWYSDSQKLIAEGIEISKGTDLAANVQVVDPEHSLILSAYSLCLPGVIYNLQKARQIDCAYINCLKNTKYGFPVDLCQAQRAHAQCKYVWGELFNLMPFATAASRLLQGIKKLLVNPEKLVDVGASIACRVFCTSPESTSNIGCVACAVVKWASTVQDLLCDFGVPKSSCANAFTGAKKLSVKDTYCQEALKEDEK